MIDEQFRPAVDPTGVPAIPTSSPERDIDDFVRAAPTATLLLLFNLAVALDTWLVARVFGVVFLLLVPGALIAATSRTRPNDGAVRLALAATASAVYLMLVALAADITLPLVGVDEPLARMPLLIVVDLSLAVMLLAVGRRRDPLAVLFGTRTPSLKQVGLAAALGGAPVDVRRRGTGCRPRARAGIGDRCARGVRGAPGRARGRR